MSTQNHLFKGRTLARSQALQLVFQAEATGRSVDDVLSGDYALSEGPLDPFGEHLARGTWSLLPELDHIISSVSANWSLYRMPAVDRNLLRLALYEILEVDEVALPVTIDECVELAKAYGTDESSRFLNGVLGTIARKLDAGEDLMAEAEAQIAEEAEAQAKAEAEAAEAEAAEDVAEAEEAGEEDASEDAADDAEEDDIEEALPDQPSRDEAPDGMSE